MSATSYVAGAPGVSRLFYHIPELALQELQAQKNPPTARTVAG